MKKATGVNREVEGGIRQGQSTRERKVNISERVAVTIYGNEYTRRSRVARVRLTGMADRLSLPLKDALGVGLK